MLAATPGLLSTLEGGTAAGTWFNDATSRYPTAVLGSIAAQRLGVSAGDQVWLADRWFTVVGVLVPLPLAPEIDRSALVGWTAASAYLGFDGTAGAILGAFGTAVYATVRDLPPVIPPWALAGGILATLPIGIVAGLYPAMRAARLSPTVALTVP